MKVEISDNLMESSLKSLSQVIDFFDLKDPKQEKLSLNLYILWVQLNHYHRFVRKGTQ